MTSNDPSFKANVFRGVQHHSRTSILKELIQNAEDAGTSRWDFIYYPGRNAASHSLARGPGILGINDGVFRVDDRLDIFQINLGTKGTDDRAIRGFGPACRDDHWAGAANSPQPSWNRTDQVAVHDNGPVSTEVQMPAA